MGIGIGLVGFSCIVLLASGVAWSLGGYSVRELLTSTSPDGRYRAVVSTRFTFPATELLDPELLVTVKLSDLHTGDQVDGVQLILMEESDMGQPRAEWSGKEVRISGLEEGHAISAVLRVDAWTAR